MKTPKLRNKGKRYIPVESNDPNVFIDLFNRMYIDWCHANLNGSNENTDFHLEGD